MGSEMCIRDSALAIQTYEDNGGDLAEWDTCAFDDQAGNTTSLDITPSTPFGTLDLTLSKQYQGALCDAQVDSDSGQLFSDSVTGLSGPEEAACATLQLELCGAAD